MKLDGKILVWTTNLDSTKSRLEGRRISKSSALQAPRLDELVEAAKRLSLETEAIPGKARPRTWWEKGGYLIVTKKNTKRIAILRLLATETRKLRATHEKAHKP